MTRVGQDKVQAASWPDDEKTFDELKARLAKTVDYLKAVPEEALTSKADEEMVVKLGNGKSYNFTGKTYFVVYAMPNFYFHVVTAYDILRAKGVPIGKLDFLGGDRFPEAT